MPAPEERRFSGEPQRSPSSAGKARLRQDAGTAGTLDAAFAAGRFRSRRAKKLRTVYSSSLSTAKNASVGICTLPRERIFFLPAREKRRFSREPQRPPSSAGKARLRQGAGIAGTLDAAFAAGRFRFRRAKKLRTVYSSSLSTAKNASVGICTLPRERIFFLPSFCFSSSFFFRVMSPP